MMNYNMPIPNIQNTAIPQIIHPMHNNMISNMNSSMNIPLTEPPKKERLRLRMTQEEKGYFQNLFSIADKKNEGRLYGKDAADFLKRSGLPKDVLKNIWIMSAQTDPQFLERDEFYLVLRLIALAQNYLEVSEESIKLNHPIPPLPKIDLKNPNASQSTPSSSISLDQSISSILTVQTSSSLPMIPEKDEFSISEEDDNKYSILFNKNKDFPDKISFNKINEMFVAAKIPSENLKKIFDIVHLNEPKFLNVFEFKVVFHLIYKSYVLKDIPAVLPNSLKYILLPSDRSGVNDIDFSLNSRTNNLNTTNQPTIINPNQPTTKENIIQKSPVEMESVLLQEFNLYKEPNLVSNSIPEKNISYPININTSNYNKINSQNHSNTNLNNLQKIKTTLTNSLNNHIEDSEFLKNIFESDKQLLNSLIEDMEKINKHISNVVEKNKVLRDEILEYRRRINFERDNLIKGTNRLYAHTNDIIKTKDENQKIKEEYNNLDIENQNYYQSNQNQSQINQYPCKPSIQNTNLTNNMNNNQNMNLDNAQNPYQNFNENYDNSQSIMNQNHNETAINSTNEKINRPISNYHSKDVSFNHDLTNTSKIENNQINAPNPYLNSYEISNPYTVSQPINQMSINSGYEPQIVFNNTQHNDNNHEVSKTNIISKSLGEVKDDIENFKIPTTNNLSVSSINLNVKEAMNSNIDQNNSDSLIGKQINNIKIPEIQEDYTTLDRDFKFEDNNINNNFNNQNLNGFNEKTNNLSHLNDQSNSIPNNNQFDSYTNNHPTKKESDFDFEFNGYDKVNTFKEIANKKGEDLFKNVNNNFEGDWDF